MRLPNGVCAVVDDAKLIDYCLSSTHPRGRHKARLFASAIGYTAADATVLKDALLRAAANSEDARETRQNRFGRYFEIEVPITNPPRSATVLSVWIVEVADEIPRLVTCYPI